MIIISSTYISINYLLVFYQKGPRKLDDTVHLPVGAVASRTVDVANVIRDYFMIEEADALNTIFTTWI